MKKANKEPLIEKLDSLLQEVSMPEIVGGLMKLSHKYKLQLKHQNNREYIGWEVIEHALRDALVEIGGDE